MALSREALVFPLQALFLYFFAFPQPLIVCSLFFPALSLLPILFTFLASSRHSLSPNIDVPAPHCSQLPFLCLPPSPRPGPGREEESRTRPHACCGPPGHLASRAPRPRADEPRVHGALSMAATPGGSRTDGATLQPALVTDQSRDLGSSTRRVACRQG